MPRAISTVVARFLHTEEVTGSNPVSPIFTASAEIIEAKPLKAYEAMSAGHPRKLPNHAGKSPVCLHRSPVCLHRSPIHLHRSPIHLHRSPIHLHRSPIHLHRSPVHPHRSPDRLAATPPKPSANLTSADVRRWTAKGIAA